MSENNSLIHAEILKTVREKMTEAVEAMTDEKLLRAMIINYRGASKNGLRLTDEGLRLMTKCYARVEILCNRTLRLKDLNFLSQKSKYPFHIDVDGNSNLVKLTHFDTEFGVMIQLCGANFDYLIDNASH